MSKSTGDIAKSRKRPAQTGEPVLVRLQPDLLSLLDQWRSEQRPIPTRPEALRSIFHDWLIGHGLLPPAPEATGSGNPPRRLSKDFLHAPPKRDDID